MAQIWLLTLLIINAFLVGHVYSADNSPQACLSTALASSRRLLEVQEKFYKCYKDCTLTIMGSSSGYADNIPDFTFNFLALARSAGVSVCARLCFDKIVDVLPANSASEPSLVYTQIVHNLLQCVGNDKSNPFINELIQFNVDHLNKSPTFVEPRKLNLFSIFYPDHLQTFWAGASIFDKSPKNCQDGILTMKAALGAYTTSLNLCQHYCLISFAAAQNADPFSMLTSVARCQHSSYYLFRADPLPHKSLLHPASEIHHVLQYCLWHTGAKSYAVTHAASFSILEPLDKSLIDYYVPEKVSKEDFLPKTDAIHLKEQLETLTAILNINGVVNEGTPAKLAPVFSALKTYYSEPTSKKKETSPGGTCDATSPSTCSLNVNDFRVVANFTGIENYRRFVVDDVLDDSQCKTLIGVNSKGGRAGDGYMATRKHGSPYTDHESFVGVAQSRLAELASDGVLKPEEVLLYIKAIDGVLEKTKQLHGVKELYLHYAHLVCREVVKSEDTNNERVPSADPSHPVHSDNCGIQQNGDCLDNDPVIAPRNYSSVLYLNDGFEGGEIFFTRRPNTKEEARVYPRCGRFVSFHSSEYHGVKALTEGTRCSLAMWFTMDKSEAEEGRAQALEVVLKLAQLTTESAPPPPLGPEITAQVF